MRLACSVWLTELCGVDASAVRALVSCVDPGLGFFLDVFVFVLACIFILGGVVYCLVLAMVFVWFCLFVAILRVCCSGWCCAILLGFPYIVFDV